MVLRLPEELKSTIKLSSCWLQLDQFEAACFSRFPVEIEEHNQAFESRILEAAWFHASLEVAGLQFCGPA